MKARKARQLSYYTKELLEIVDDYKAEAGDERPHLYQVAKWARGNGRLELPSVDIDRILAKQLAAACRQDYINDENGEPVRKRHAVKVEVNGKQLTLWPNMDRMTPEQMRKSLSARRRGCAQDALQIERDRRYFNGHYNHGEQIEIDFNINLDIDEHYQSDEYPDQPPPGA